jgi:hypothetical protein
MSNKINAPKNVLVLRMIFTLGVLGQYCKPLVHKNIVLTYVEDMFYQLRLWF